MAAVVTGDSSTSILNATVGADATSVRTFVGLSTEPSDFTPGTERATDLQRDLAVFAQHGGMLDAAILAPDGTVIASASGVGQGQPAPGTSGLTNALQGQHLDAAIVTAGSAGTLAPAASGSVLRQYFPIVENGQTTGLVAVWRDATPILAELDAMQRNVVLITVLGAIVSAILLGLVFRAAYRRMADQSLRRLEAARRDPLTDSLGHGALVEMLTARMDQARPSGGAIALALIDIDHFRLFNDTYLRAAGDRILVALAGHLEAEFGSDVVWGRYGPDEFLVIAPGRVAIELAPAIDHLRATFGAVPPEVVGGEPLRATFSAGICAFPVNGRAVTTLLAMAALTLDEARASGGDTILVAEAGLPATAQSRTFDVLEGLIVAVDAKDRYARGHAEAVAGHADLIAAEIGLDGDTRQAIHRAALLLDVGKIGVPDSILRRVGRLSDEEYGVLQEHVVLGESLVRDLPGLDIIRAGILHHHERWDGHGYLSGLAGTDIPLVARILAIADAFAAMTAERPYRADLTVDEALERLQEAAGSQFDPDLVDVFAHAMRTPSGNGAGPAKADAGEQDRLVTSGVASA